MVCRSFVMPANAKCSSETSRLLSESRKLVNWSVSLQFRILRALLLRMFVRFAYKYFCRCFQVLMRDLSGEKSVPIVPKADFADWPWVLAGPKRSLLFVQVSVWQIKSRLSPSHCVAHCADFHRHGNRSQFSSAGDGVTEQPLRYMWEKNQKTFLCRDCTGCCQVENDTIEADASLCPQRIQQKGPPFRNQTVALSWNVVLGWSRYLLLQTMKYCNPIKTTNTNWKRLRMQFQTLQHERDWAVTDEWYRTNLRRLKPNAISTSATNRKKNDDWVRKLSNLQSVHWVHDEGNEKLGIVCVSPGRIRSWKVGGQETQQRSGGLPTFAIDRTPRFECLHRCSTKQDPPSTGWFIKLNKGLKKIVDQ